MQPRAVPLPLPLAVPLALRPTAKSHAPDHVIGVPAGPFRISGHGAFMQADHLGEVERVDKFTGTVDIGHEPPYQLLDHELVPEDLLVRGVRLHAGDGSRGKHGRPTDIDCF